MIGSLTAVPALDALDLVAEPVAAALKSWPGAAEATVAEIDPALSDTVAFCETYDVPLSASANCVLIAATRAGQTRYAACMVLATQRADVNGLARKRMDARKASFMPMDVAVAESGMEYGGITPIGLPEEWPILVDAAVVALDNVVIGSGVRRSKIALPGAALATLPGAEVVEGLGR